MPNVQFLTASGIATACAVINVELMLAAWPKQWVTALRCTVAHTARGRVLLGQLQHFSAPMRQRPWPLLLKVSQVCKWNWKLSIGSSNYLIQLRAPRKIQLRARTCRRDSCAVQAPPLALIWFTAIFRGALKKACSWSMWHKVNVAQS